MKAAINGCEAHIGDFIEMSQLIHDELAHLTRADLTLSEPTQSLHDTRDGSLDPLLFDGSFLQRFE